MGALLVPKIALRGSLAAVRPAWTSIVREPAARCNWFVFRWLGAIVGPVFCARKASFSGSGGGRAGDWGRGDAKGLGIRDWGLERAAANALLAWQGKGLAHAAEFPAFERDAEGDQLAAEFLLLLPERRLSLAAELGEEAGFARGALHFGEQGGDLTGKRRGAAEVQRMGLVLVDIREVEVRSQSPAAVVAPGGAHGGVGGDRVPMGFDEGVDSRAPRGEGGRLVGKAHVFAPFLTSGV